MIISKKNTSAKIAVLYIITDQARQARQSQQQDGNGRTAKIPIIKAIFSKVKQTPVIFTIIFGFFRSFCAFFVHLLLLFAFFVGGGG